MELPPTARRAFARPLPLATAVLITLAGLASASGAQTIPPYDNLTERQNAVIEARLGNPAPNLSLDFSTANEFAINAQSHDLVIEFEGQARGLTGTAGVTHAEGDAHLRAIIERLDALMVNPPQGWNRMIAYQAGLFTAYLLHRFPTIWSESTRDAARNLYRDSISNGDYNDPGKWDSPADLLGDSRAACTGMRLLGGEALGDAELFEFARGEIDRTRARIARGQHGHMQPHYTGANIRVLGLMTQVDDLPTRDAIKELLEWVLLLPAHLYLPGGGLGAPKNRTKGQGGGVEDPNPLDSAKLQGKINGLIYDEDLTAGSDPILATVTTYAVPEIIRSIFLDKGDGYRFRHNQVNHTDPLPAAPETHTFPFGWQGWEGAPMAEPLGVIPWETVTLPGGDASMGIKYGGERTGHSVSNGVYLRRPGGSSDFSILYHYQKEVKGGQTAGVDEDDPNWNRERETPWRRMLYERTSVSLWDVDYPEATQYQYTLASVPDFANPAVADHTRRVVNTASGFEWIIGQSGSAYVAFLPLGQFTETPEPGEDWLRLRSDDPVSGNITELATTADFATIDLYRDDLRDRFVSFSGTSGANAVAEVDVITDHSTSPKTMQRIRLEYDPELRLVDGVGQSDANFLLSDGYFESPWTSWDDSEFELSVSRTGYTPLTLDFGDPTRPTAPHQVEAELLTASIRLDWEHGWDDTAITEYVIYRSDDPGTEVARVAGSQTTHYVVPPAHPTGLTKYVTYSIASVDGPPPTPEDGSEMSLGRGVSGLVEVPGDGDPPSIPDGLAGTTNLLTWNPSTDNSGTVAGYDVYRDGTLVGTVSEPAFRDGNQSSLTAYSYTITAFDPDGNVSTPSAPWLITTGADALSPTPPVINYSAANTTAALFAWDASSDDVGVTQYLVFRDGALYGSTTTLLFFIDQLIDEGATYVYTVVALDAAGNWSAPSQPGATLSIPDVTPPSTPTITGSEKWPPLGLAFVYWTEATDNVGVVDYELLRDGVVVGAFVGTTGVEVVAPGTYSYTVRARDTAGNISPESGPEIVVMP